MNLDERILKTLEKNYIGKAWYLDDEILPDLKQLISDVLDYIEAPRQRSTEFLHADKVLNGTYREGWSDCYHDQENERQQRRKEIGL